LFQDLIFHVGSSGRALEMREFSESHLKSMLQAAGFGAVSVYGEDYPPYGIVHAESCSLPMAARKGTFALSREATRDVLEQWRELKQKLDGDMRRLGRSYWFRLGRKMGWL
jgi:hypothetical protein